MPYVIAGVGRRSAFRRRISRAAFHERPDRLREGHERKRRKNQYYRLRDGNDSPRMARERKNDQENDADKDGDESGFTNDRYQSRRGQGAIELNTNAGQGGGCHEERRPARESQKARLTPAPG